MPSFRNEMFEGYKTDEGVERVRHSQKFSARLDVEYIVPNGTTEEEQRDRFSFLMSLLAPNNQAVLSYSIQVDEVLDSNSKSKARSKGELWGRR